MNSVHPQNKPNNQKIVQSSLHHDIESLLILIQLCGQLPINGICGRNVDFINFKYASIKIIYFTLICGGMGFLTGLHIYGVLKYGADFNLITILMFYCCVFLLNICFFKVAIKWKNLMKQWNDMEMYFNDYGKLEGLKSRINTIVISFSCGAIMLYTLEIISSISVTLQCKNFNENELQYFFQNVFFKSTFTIIEYTTVTGFILQIIYFIGFFFWLLTDAFIIIISTALAMRFQQVNLKIKSALNHKLMIFAWREIRAHYNKLCRLCKLLDDVISPVILVSFGYNLFAILIELFNSLRSKRNNIERTYFFVSFGSIILRVIVVTLYGAWINDESKRPISILNSASSDIYNTEIAGAIVTYELVLIQFNENLLKEQYKNDTSDNC